MSVIYCIFCVSVSYFGITSVKMIKLYKIHPHNKALVSMDLSLNILKYR